MGCGWGVGSLRPTRLRHFQQYLRMPHRNLQQHLRRPGWRSPALLPVLQRIGADAQNRRKLRLRQTQLATHPHNVGLRIHLKHTPRLQLPALDQGCFAQALLQLFKKVFFHNPNSSTKRLSCLISSCDRSSLSLFA